MRGNGGRKFGMSGVHVLIESHTGVEFKGRRSGRSQGGERVQDPTTDRDVAAGYRGLRGPGVALSGPGGAGLPNRRFRVPRIRLAATPAEVEFETLPAPTKPVALPGPPDLEQVPEADLTPSMLEPGPGDLDGPSTLLSADPAPGDDPLPPRDEQVLPAQAAPLSAPVGAERRRRWPAREPSPWGRRASAWRSR